jgi:uncharacterized damage-inducible protein DinB
MLPDYLLRLFEYDADSNRAILKAAREAFSTDDTPARIFAHVVLAMHLWLLRLREEYKGTEPVWDVVEWDDLAERVEANRAEVEKYLRAATSETLSAPITYRNTRGDVFESSPADILQHVIVHGAYHRGQVARALRERGFDPPVTDFIRWVRD